VSPTPLYLGVVSLLYSVSVLIISLFIDTSFNNLPKEDLFKMSRDNHNRLRAESKFDPPQK